MVIEDLFLRSEPNGLSVYDQSWDLFQFFKGVDIDSISDCKTKGEFYGKLHLLGLKPSIDIDLRYPVRINWMLCGRCNLNCVYCMAHNKEVPLTEVDLEGIASHLLTLNPLTVCLSGGEPLMAEGLANVIKMLSGKTGLILDTNGTIPLSDALLKVLREARVLVRISIDAIDPKTIRETRDANGEEAEAISRIGDNINLLHGANIPVNVHTVVTTRNMDFLADVGSFLCEKGIRRWHLYGLNRIGKAKSIYEDYNVEASELSKLETSLQRRFPGICITAIHANENAKETNALVIDPRGRYFKEKWDGNPEFIGKDPLRPTLDEILHELDVESYVRGYYGQAMYRM